ncbi:uncharacterized protein EURHEDRAFT_381765 [Aspergillus ruber CBS 135680]|uniref:Uncharacterized protein n=1 Tax=Aspergillus ruber (strain CBS 135680) TaxID=1388766 RepID=A0A017S149_ASPRC|nr:uncharacterized protein EURHEDRAFT_381765 [Aspergillus ruber CBS 135680]EYE90662.1 hypothetical protein EURHEDRAFT_381765 [Aspergillus ruber CBS 135680]
MVHIERAGQIQDARLFNGQLWHFTDGPLEEARDSAMTLEVKGIQFSHSLNQRSDPATQTWCYGYDVEEIDTARLTTSGNYRSALSPEPAHYYSVFRLVPGSPVSHDFD